MQEHSRNYKGHSIIGTRVDRVDAFDKVTGRARYGADYNLSGQLYGAVHYTEHPHADILSIDIEAAINKIYCCFAIKNILLPFYMLFHL